jgi:beta-lysine 5,6-aminomutase beta subunit
VDNAALLTRAKELGADAVLVSQVMTQRDLHIENSRQLMELAHKQGMRGLLFLLGGPRIDHKLAREWGFDAGFGPGTKPSQVASFVVDTLLKRGS